MLRVLSIDEGAEQTSVMLSISGQTLTRDALNKALYWLADEFSLSEQPDGAVNEGDFLLALTVQSGQEVQVSIESIRRSLLDFAVRDRIETQTRPVRNEIVTTALRALTRGAP